MTQRWGDRFAQAEHDLEQAVSSARDERHDWACFAAHQAGEKALKALHLRQGREVWGHVISRLLNELSESPPPGLVDRARILDGYYVPARYPNGHVDGPAFEHFGSLHSSQAVDHAREIIDFVRRAMADG